MACYLITEGETDALLLTALLEPSAFASEVVVVAGRGRSASVSLARSILAVRQEPVLLVLDADTSDPVFAQERQRSLEEALVAFAPPSRYRVLLVQPEMEALYFADKNLLKKLVGKTVSDQQFLRGEYTPHLVLKELFGERPEMRLSLAKKLTSEDLTKLRQTAFFVS